MTRSTVRIRKATAKDIQWLTDLRVELLREIGNLTPRTDVLKLRRAIARYYRATIQAGTFYAFVAEAGSEIVAISGLTLERQPPFAGNLSGRTAYIMNMYTKPTWRRKGIASSLLAEVLEFLRKKKIEKVHLLATPQGKSVYEESGFHVRTADKYMERHLGGKIRE